MVELPTGRTRAVIVREMPGFWGGSKAATHSSICVCVCLYVCLQGQDPGRLAAGGLGEFKPLLEHQDVCVNQQLEKGSSILGL